MGWWVWERFNDDNIATMKATQPAVDYREQELQVGGLGIGLVVGVMMMMTWKHHLNQQPAVDPREQELQVGVGGCVGNWVGGYGRGLMIT